MKHFISSLAILALIGLLAVSVAGDRDPMIIGIVKDLIS